MRAASCSRTRRRTSARTVLAARFCAVRCSQPDNTGRSASCPRLMRQGQKHALRDILGQMGVADHPHRGGMDQVHMPAHQFGKRRLRPVPA